MSFSIPDWLALWVPYFLSFDSLLPAYVVFDPPIWSLSLISVSQVLTNALLWLMGIVWTLTHECLPSDAKQLATGMEWLSAIHNRDGLPCIYWQNSSPAHQTLDPSNHSDERPPVSSLGLVPQICFLLLCPGLARLAFCPVSSTPVIHSTRGDLLIPTLFSCH